MYVSFAIPVNAMNLQKVVFTNAADVGHLGQKILISNNILTP
mgnify:CR=1 FL=1|tara:strand:+ start:70 stop:195 length:126 start_codon:yes stop_codon:yes gene_type:complete